MSALWTGLDKDFITNLIIIKNKYIYIYYNNLFLK